MSSLRYTNRPPTATGFYWINDGKGYETIVKVTGTNPAWREVIFFGCDRPYTVNELLEHGYEFAGPIAREE
jgi:hypothetical protein